MTLGKHDENDGRRPDGARLTAYAFGELEGAEREAVEAMVAADPVLRAEVAELRAFGGVMGAALKIEAGAPEAARAASSEAAREEGGGSVLRFPWWAWAAVGVAAAGVAVMVGTGDGPPETDRERGKVVQTPAETEKVRTPAVVASQEIGPVLVGPTLPTVPVELTEPGKPTEPMEPIVAVSAPVLVGDAQASPPVAAEPVAVPVTAKEVASLLAKGRTFYVAGDVAGATEAFRSAETLQPGNVEARYFLKRIALDQAEAANLTRVANRAQLLSEVALGWQRPGTYSDANTGIYSQSSSEMMAGYAGDAPVTGASDVGFRQAGMSAGNESYSGIRESGFVAVAAEPLSTFSVDVDTASYSNVRRFLREGARPPRDAVRVEELVNYFPYRYAGPAARDGAPFAANLAVAAAPWAPAHRLVRVGIKGRELTAETRQPANLVFLVDVSGSMGAENKLPLVKTSLRMLLGRLRADDRVAIVTYAGASGLALPSTPAGRREEILGALERLESGGSTNGGMGIHLAYDIAKANFRPEGINRVILCTDGDFNVGVTGREALLELIREKARSRVFLTVLGFGMGNLKDGTLEMLADKGNGTYGYIDSAREARKVFVEQVEGTLATIAKDVKIQVEFNPARVASYRLIGYENRLLAKEDFNNDRVDAGEVGAGHTVTALYEVVPAGGSGAPAGDEGRPVVDALKYGTSKPTIAAVEAAGAGAELLTVKIRYKEPTGDVSRKLEFPLVDGGAGFEAADGEFKFAAAVAAWGMWLRESPQAGTTTVERVLEWAEGGLGNDAEGHRAEFVELVRRGRGLR